MGHPTALQAAEGGANVSATIQPKAPESPAEPVTASVVKAEAEQESDQTKKTTALSFAESGTSPPSVHEMDSQALGTFVRDGIIGLATKLAELKPYVEELWRRIDRGEVILGCSTKKEFCKQVLQRTPRAVRYMLEGGNHNRGETVSSSKPHQVTDAEFAEYEREHPHVRQSATNMLAQGMSPTDVIGALVGMNVPKPMAEAAVRIVSGGEPEPTPQPAPKAEPTLKDVLEQLVEVFVVREHADPANVWQQIVEIGQAKLNGGRS